MSKEKELIEIASEIIGSRTISEAILAVADIAEILNDQRLEAGGGW